MTGTQDRDQRGAGDAAQAGAPALAARLTDLEIHVAHQTLTIDELSDTVRRQWDEIDALKRRLAFVAQRLAEAQADPQTGDAPPPDQPPPHY